MPKNHQNSTKISDNFGEFFPKTSFLFEIFENLTHEKNVELVDLVKPFPTVLRLLNLVSIQPRTDRSKFGSEKREYNIFCALLSR